MDYFDGAINFPHDLAEGVRGLPFHLFIGQLSLMR